MPRADGVADTEFTDDYQLPGHELLEEDELAVPVVPMQSNEFRCARCFLVLHRRMAASQRGTEELCRDCA